MNLFRGFLSRFASWRAAPYAVMLLGLLATAALVFEVANSDRVYLEQRFDSAASARAESIIRPFENQLAMVAVLQRAFHAVGELDEQKFEQILGPISWSPGLRGFAWAPRIEAAARAAFEAQGRKRRGDTFAISTIEAGGSMLRSSERDIYYPVQFQTPLASRRPVHGLDLYSIDGRAPLIDQAIRTGTVLSTGLIPSVAGDPNERKVVVFVAPVFHGAGPPMLPEERSRSVAGILVASMDIGELFEMAASLDDAGLLVTLSDFSEPGKAIQRGPDLPAKSAPSSGSLALTRNFVLAGHMWTVRVEAGPLWLAANRTNRSTVIGATGGALTLLLAFLTFRLLARQRRAEAYAGSLSLVVEQNPASIVITDLAGRVEYVNAMFLQSSGYARDEVIGRRADMLGVGDAAPATYREMHEVIRSGQPWHGELPSRRRDGSIYWERVHIAPVRDTDGAITNVMAVKEDITELRELTSRLQESEARFRGAMTVMAEGLAVLSPEGFCLFANRAVERIIGAPEGGLQGVNARNLPLHFLDNDEREIPSPFDDAALMQSLCREREIRNRIVGLRVGDEAVRWLEVSTSPLQVEDGKTPRVVMTFSDITERRLADEKARLAFEAIRHSGEGILVTDAEHRIVSVNPAFETVTGYAADEVLGNTPVLFSSTHQDESFFATMRAILERAGHWQGEVWNRRKNGELYPEWLGVSAVREADGSARYYVYIFSDMTERKAAQARIEFLAHHDPLTELPNRLLLRDRMAQAMALAARSQSRVALLFLDLDRFKKINDSLGHPVGDALLKAIVDRLKGCVRDSDTISRQGGDEFIIVLNEVRDTDAVARVADKIQQRMGQPFHVGEHNLMTSFSIGVAIYPDDGNDFDTLLKKADTAMYHAKEAGRNSHRFFTEQMNLQVVEHLTLETQLRRALDNREFVLHYQPQLDLQERTIVGVEALVRWNNPESGLVPPGKFIPVAEDSGLIVQIGAWVLREACRQARAWQDAGLPPFVMAVNLSAIQFKRLDLVNTVIEALVLSDLDSQWLELELTESILLQDAEATLDTVHRLKALGVKLSVDDFGTGYSSLAYLKRFAVDKLKIDQSFVRDLASDPDDAAIVRAIIQMAHSLKLRTIAEGVETEELCNLLQLFRCDEVQGYWLAQPLPADELETFVRDFSGGTAGN